MVARVMAIVLVLEMNGFANARMDGVEKTVQRHKRPTAGMILTTIMVCIPMNILFFTYKLCISLGTF
jgi:Na+-translocating ferredoxin:NAD+ oxidoreductase RnfE subunit